MRQVSQTTQFARDVKKIRKRGKDLEKLRKVVKKIANCKALQKKCRDHALTGQWHPARDCHIEPDWILIYTVDKNTLRLERTGTHSDLFNK